jgi:hypothetical protein
MTEIDSKLTVDVGQKKKADMRIKLHYHGLTMGAFIRGAIDAYVSGDEKFFEWFGHFRAQHSKYSGSKTSLSKIEAEEALASETMDTFGIGDKELDDIFDIIAEEHPDL